LLDELEELEDWPSLEELLGEDSELLELLLELLLLLEELEL